MLSLVTASGALSSIPSPILAQPFFQTAIQDVEELPEPLDLGTAAIVSQPLHRAANASGRYFGAATRMDYLRKEKDLRALVASECSHITPEIHLKWDSVEGRKGKFNFEPVDDLLVFAQRHGLVVRGHTLLWDQSTPDWAKHELAVGRDWATISSYFKTVLGRYGAKIEEWDVVNEPIDTETGDNDFRKNAFFNAFGPSYIDQALREARDQAPQSRLIINDYGFDYDNAVEASRRKAFISLVERLVSKGAPLSGVGVQAHLDLSKGPIKQKIVGDFLGALAATGVDVTITELDVKEDDFGSSIERRDSRVADEVERYLDVALSEPAVRGVVTWGISDRHSWLSDAEGAGRPAAPGPVSPQNRGLPYDDALNAKPMYWAIKGALEGAANGGRAYSAPKARTVSQA